MKQPSRYAYEKRIKELEDQVSNLRAYKDVAIQIFNTVTDQIQEGKGISTACIVKQYRSVFK